MEICFLFIYAIGFLFPLRFFLALVLEQITLPYIFPQHGILSIVLVVSQAINMLCIDNNDLTIAMMKMKIHIKGGNQCYCFDEEAGLSLLRGFELLR